MGSCFWGHNWGKWEQYSLRVQTYGQWLPPMGMPNRIWYQKRSCRDCGRVEVDELYGKLPETEEPKEKE